MCGRYSLFQDDDCDEIRKIIETVGKNHPESEITTGEVAPSTPAPVLLGKGGAITAQAMVWGFPNLNGKGIVINARAETAPEKRMFQSCFMAGRCIIPSTGFYEWRHDETKQKFHFHFPETRTLYMAGLCREYNGQRRFVILTTAPNCSMRGIHDRMPLVLTGESIRQWLLDAAQVFRILSRTPPELAREAV